jgi:hypothetical protein
MYRYEAPAKLVFRGGLVLLAVLCTGGLLVPSWIVMLAELEGVERAATLRAACATGATILLLVAVVNDFRGRQPANRSWSFLAAMGLATASVVLRSLV